MLRLNLTDLYRHVRDALLVTTVCSTLVGGALTASAQETSPLQRLKDRSGDIRWEETRDKWLLEESVWKPTSAPRMVTTPPKEIRSSVAKPAHDPSGTTPIPLLSPFDQRDTPQPFPHELVESRQPVTNLQVQETGNTTQPVTNLQVQGTDESTQPAPSIMRAVPAPYQDETSGRSELTGNNTAASDLLAPPFEAPLTSPIPAIDLPTVTADEGQFLVPGGITRELRIADANDIQPVPYVPETEAETLDAIFRPITEIEPYHDYSPRGMDSRRYLCPQPSDIPENERERCPEMVSLPAYGIFERECCETFFHWEASNLSHNPLYFEDVSLERYGHTYHPALQPFVSVGRFGLQVAGLPYTMALDPAWKEQYALGYYRPGDVAPRLKYRIPYNTKAAVTAAGVYTGLIFLFP